MSWQEKRRLLGLHSRPAFLFLQLCSDPLAVPNTSIWTHLTRRQIARGGERWPLHGPLANVCIHTAHSRLRTGTVPHHICNYSSESRLYSHFQLTFVITVPTRVCTLAQSQITFVLSIPSHICTLAQSQLTFCVGTYSSNSHFSVLTIPTHVLYSQFHLTFSVCAYNPYSRFTAIAYLQSVVTYRYTGLTRVMVRTHQVLDQHVRACNAFAGICHDDRRC